MTFSRLPILVGTLGIIAVTFFFISRSPIEIDPSQPSTPTPVPSHVRNVNPGIDLSTINSKFRFLLDGDLPWRVEYIPESQAINLYGQPGPGDDEPGNHLEESQIFIRYFTASDFLTLSTVDILKREAITINGHDSVRYEIQKKANVPNFPHQPSWRNQRHSLVDIRFSNQSPTTFYVIARNPNLSEDVFNKFLESIRFHNNPETFAAVIQAHRDRVTKKPFGLYVDPTNSPVNPERFSGYHTGADFESSPQEVESNVPVFALCGGPIVQKKISPGYGGVVVQGCIINNDPITVVYGHLRYSEIRKSVGDYMAPTDWFAVLGKGYTTETDNERAHLHLSIHKGKQIDIRGYVQNQSELSAWIDPLTILPR